MGGESVDSVVSSNVSKPKQFEEVSGARKVWGTMRETTVKAVTGVISKLCPPAIEFKIKRKTQGIMTLATNLDGGLLFTLKRMISPHSNQHGVLSLTTPNGSSAPATNLSLTSQLNLMTQNHATQIIQMSPTANSTNHLTASSIAPNENLPFLRATPGETTTPP